MSGNRAEYEKRIKAAQHRFLEWRMRPAPQRGAMVKRLGELLREHKVSLGELISREVGKIRTEGLGEVQEMIDICDFAVGLSRQVYGLTIASERPQHRMSEQWLPLGPVGIITAFNFPMAVWAWNASLAAVCGDVCLWKPSPLTPLCASAVQGICDQVCSEFNAQGVFTLLPDDIEVGEWMTADTRLPLISFTGSIRVGRKVGVAVAERFGRSLLELGGNNAAIILNDANVDLAVRAVAFGAIGTAGQRCTSTRRVFVQLGIAKIVTEKLIRAFASAKVGPPLNEGVLMGPLIHLQAIEKFVAAIATAEKQGGKILCGGKKLPGDGNFVEPTLILAPKQEDFPIAFEETFAPILYLFTIDTLDEAIAANNAVPQGLSSAIFTDSLRSAERFLSAAGSDCGLANVNTGTSGAEIGGAFGGEKETGGGRESGSDAWKAYMRRQSSVVNWGNALPLAQGVEFT